MTGKLFRPARAWAMFALRSQLFTGLGLGGFKEMNQALGQGRTERVLSWLM